MEGNDLDLDIMHNGKYTVIDSDIITIMLEDKRIKNTMEQHRDTQNLKTFLIIKVVKIYQKQWYCE